MIEVIVERLIWRGRGLGRLSSGKKVIILPPVLQEERVLGKVVKEKKDYVEIEPVKILSPSKYRVPHPCEVSHLCGGCRFGVIEDGFELELKKEIFIKEFQRSLRTSRDLFKEKEIIVFPSPKKWGYRWRGQVFVADKKAHFKKLKTNELVPIRGCLLFSNPLNERLREKFFVRDKKVIISGSPLTRDVFTEFDNGPLILPYYDYHINLQVHPSVFFQANWDLNQSLVDFVIHAANEFDNIADLYAGCGNFSVPLTKLKKNVVAVENNPLAVNVLGEFKRSSGAELVVKKMDLGKKSPYELIKKHGVECVILDPPRSGGSKFVHELINYTNLKRIIWVSCDIVNTARDIRPVLKNGFRIKKMALFDMFPKTYHMEATLILDRDQ